MENNFKLKLLEQDKFIKKMPYTVKEVTDPILFNANKIPTTNGLLSNEIFGSSPKERKTTCGYINLHANFFHGAIFDILTKYSNKFTLAASGARKFSIVNGSLIDDENGGTGMEWLVKNFHLLKFNDPTEDSLQKRILSETLSNYKKFMNTIIVIPPFFRDVDTSKGMLTVGKLNEIYIDILRLTKSMAETDIYGINLKNGIMYKLQLKIVELYNYFMDIKYPDSSDTVLGKEGVIYRTMYRKTLNYTSRLVLSQPDSNVEHWKDMSVNVDTTLVPLDSAASQLFPFVVFELKNILYKYADGDIIKAYDRKNKEIEVTVSGMQKYYSDEEIGKYVKRFIKSMSIRFSPVPIPNDFDTEAYFIFDQEYEDGEKIKRPLTWTDLIFIATTRAARGKHMVSVRYPFDTAYNQVIHKIKVASTSITKNLKYEEELLDYPVISIEDINADTSNKFMEVCNISNATIGSMGADYDGDTTNNKILFSEEANKEAEEYVNSLRRCININGSFIYEVPGESYMMAYSLTKDVGDEKLGMPVF